MKLAIGIATIGTIKSQTVLCLIRLLKELTCDYAVIIKDGSILHANREIIVERAIELKCTHLLFIDSDMYFEPDAASRLLKRDKDIVGVHYNLRQLPPTSTVHMPKDTKANIVKEHPDGFLKCDAVGTGFLLIKTAVFEKLSHPWFFWGSNDKGEVTTGEDYWFCTKAREAGYYIWVDLTIPIKHIGDYLY